VQNRREILKLQSAIRKVKISNSNTRKRELGEELLNFLVSVVNQLCSQLHFFFPYFSGTVSSVTKYNSRREDIDSNVIINNLKKKRSLFYLKTQFVRTVNTLHLD
jgi:hypothetical protein